MPEATPKKGFGLLPRAIVWVFLGITIYMAFAIFAAGTPVLLEKVGFQDTSIILQSELSWKKVFVSFSIATALNLFYAPVMMTFHKITDIHIPENGGSLQGFFRKLTGMCSGTLFLSEPFHSSGYLPKPLPFCCPRSSGYCSLPSWA